MKLGLRIRFFLYSNTVIAVTMILVTVLGTMYERRIRYDGMVSHGVSLAEAMAIPIAEALGGDPTETPRPTLIATYIDDILARNPSFMHRVTVADPALRVVHSSDDEVVGSRLNVSIERTVEVGRSRAGQVRSDDGEHFLEVRTPLLDGDRTLGWLAVSYSLAPIERQVREVAKRAALVALLLMLGNSIMTALYVETLIRPILNLNQTMKKAGEGNLTVRAPTRRGDEVAELGDVFNRMMDELEASREREELQRAQLAHTEKMAAVGTLAAGVAHEVNNPLAGVLASIENLRDNPEDEEMRDRYLGLIADGLRRIERTVANLLNFARAREIKLEPTSLNHNMQHVIELVEYQFRAGGVDVVTDFDSQPAVVEADHFQMEQLFLNLYLNALDAMPDGGTLRLRTRVRGGKVIAEVRDSGTGIPADVRDHVFDPFFTTKEIGEGTGLGLAVSGSIVAAHGGTIELETSVGRGTTFRVIMAAMPGDWDEGVPS
jgi:signal transduction histidine kinase